jgi:hypothetical protein
VLTGSGHSVSEIAGLLRISPLTVENGALAVADAFGLLPAAVPAGPPPG